MLSKHCSPSCTCSWSRFISRDTARTLNLFHSDMFIKLTAVHLSNKCINRASPRARWIREASLGAGPAMKTSCPGMPIGMRLMKQCPPGPLCGADVDERKLHNDRWPKPPEKSSSPSMVHMIQSAMDLLILQPVSFRHTASLAGRHLCYFESVSEEHNTIDACIWIRLVIIFL